MSKAEVTEHCWIYPGAEVAVLVLPAPRAENQSVEANDPTRPFKLGALRLGGAVAAVLGACFAVFIAYITNALLSSGDVGDHETPLLIAQLVIALAGWVPAGLFARALVRGDDRHAVVWLVVGLVVYLVWGVFDDASVHGWANLKVF